MCVNTAFILSCSLIPQPGAVAQRSELDLVLNERCLGFSCRFCDDKTKPPEGMRWLCGQGAAGVEISERSWRFWGVLIAFLIFLLLEALICCSGSCEFPVVLSREKNRWVWVKTATCADVRMSLVVRAALGASCARIVLFALRLMMEMRSAPN